MTSAYILKLMFRITFTRMNSARTIDMSPSITDFHSLTPNLSDNKFSLKLLSCYNLSYIFHARESVQNVHNCSYSLCTALKSINSINISLCPAQCIMTPRAYHSNSGFNSIIIIILTTNVYHLLLYHQNYHLNTPHCLNLQSLLWHLLTSLYPYLSSTSALTMTM